MEQTFARGAGSEWLADMSEGRVAYMLVAGLAGGCLGALSEWADVGLPHRLQMALDAACWCLLTPPPLPLALFGMRWLLPLAPLQRSPARASSRALAHALAHTQSLAIGAAGKAEQPRAWHR